MLTGPRCEVIRLSRAGSAYKLKSLLDEEEFVRWLGMAGRTARSAEGDLERGDYNWACFKAQQAAEFAVKALLHGLGLEAYGHSVSGLLLKLPKSLDPSDVMQRAKTLDKYYIPTRYPNAWAQDLPTDYYTERDARDAIKCAGEIIKWVRGSWSSLSRGRRRGRR